MSETQYVKFDGHRIAYRVAGSGPAVVVLQLYRRRDDLIHLRLLSKRWQVFEVAPLGYGRSTRVPGYAGEALPHQIHAVLDRHGVERYIIWGYSKGGAMALCIARGSPRAAALVCGGYSPIGFLTDGVMRRLDRHLRPDHPGRTLWPWVKGFDWSEELMALTCPGLLYWGSDDRQMANGLRRTREHLMLRHLDFIEFEGLDHGAFNDTTFEEVVAPAVVSWIGERMGTHW